MTHRPGLLFLLVLAATVPAGAQDRQLPLEDVIREKAGHLRLSGVWISGGAFDLGLRSVTGVNQPTIRAYSVSAGMSLNWTYLGARTNAWGNYVGDYSLASRSSLDSLSQSAELGFLRRVTPRFSLGLTAQAQSLNLGARLFQQPRAARQLQSPGFAGGMPTVGLGNSTDPIAEAGAALLNTDTFGLTLGANQRVYSVGAMTGLTISPRTDFRLGASVSQSEFPPAAGVSVQLPYNRMLGGFLQGSLRHLATPRTSVNWSFQAGQSRAQSEKFNFASNTFGISRVISTAWYIYAAGGGGASTVFRAGARVPWLVQYTAQSGIGYASQRQGLVVSATHDAGDRLALGFLSTSQLNIFWNIRPPASGWAFSLRAGGVLLRAEQQPGTKAGSLQMGLSRRLFGDVYALGEGTYVTNVLFAPQRLFPSGTNSSLLDTTAQRAVRLSIVYRPAPDRK